MSHTRKNRSPGRPKAGTAKQPLDKIILSNAIELFMEQGYELISVQQIAKVSHVTKASIYYHFQSKACLFTAALIHLMETRRHRVREQMKRNEPLRSRLETIALHRLSHSYIDIETLIREAEPALTPEQTDNIHQSLQRFYLSWATDFQTAMNLGQLPQGNAMLLAHTFCSILMLGSRSYATTIYSSKEELARSIVHLFLKGAEECGGS